VLCAVVCGVDALHCSMMLPCVGRSATDSPLSQRRTQGNRAQLSAAMLCLLAADTRSCSPAVNWDVKRTVVTLCKHL